ncbi:hypothetical protein F7734_54970 [Scytonema sp. UIC 10036]|uniref:hypothetical protein n=1 Tax=Scytonema sp. UIC 10036 TaxID=2304196 RepID=UPI0012DACAA0|nr:hypothetical protein [Scytonema sp. UIC 10036]MUH00894.1 hypothetical protein [Scytonema sp. UIC 10036]
MPSGGMVSGVLSAQGRRSEQTYESRSPLAQAVPGLSFPKVLSKVLTLWLPVIRNSLNI